MPVSEFNSSELVVRVEGIDDSSLDRVKLVEAYIFTPEELKQLLEDYTSKIVENAEGIYFFNNYSESTREGVEINKESITSQLPKFLKEIL